jgi:hypothetical protein
VRLALAGGVHPAVKNRSEGPETALPWSLGNDSIVCASVFHKGDKWELPTSEVGVFTGMIS